MNLDVQVEGRRIASELQHLREGSQVAHKPPLNTLFILAVRGVALSCGLIASALSFLFLDAQLAFITITCIGFSTFGLVIGGRKVAGVLALLEKRLFFQKRNSRS